MPEIAISRTVIDGVPVFQAPSTSESLTHVALMFRVGTADETLPLRGITHLVEHLGLARTAGRGHPHNAQVELIRTLFWAEGTAEEVCDFMAAVTESLSNLPVDRIDDEMRVLRTEAASQSLGSTNNRLHSRFGAAGYGLTDYEQFGLRWIGADHVLDWARHWFTSSNAAAMVSGPLPDGLHFHLPQGEARPVPKAQPRRLTHPAIDDSGVRGISVSMMAPRAEAVVMANRILDMRVSKRLRFESSLAYQAGSLYTGLDTDGAEIAIFADALPENLQQAGDQILAVIDELAATGPTADELQAEVANFRRNFERPEIVMAELDRAASDQIFGMKRPTMPQLVQELEALTSDQVAAATREARTSILAIVPSAAQVRFTGFTTTDPPLEPPLGDQVLRPMPGKGLPDKLHFGSDGLSLESGSGHTVYSIRWSEVAAALWWTSGRRAVIGNSGTTINFFPERWQDSQRFAQAVQAFVPADRWVPMDEPGSMPRQAEPICSICEATPAVELSIRKWTPTRRTRVRAVLCRDCAIAEIRNDTAPMIGWCFVPLYWLFMPLGIGGNLVLRSRIRKLGPPVRSAGKNPLKKGRPLYLRLSIVSPAIWVAWFVYTFVRL